jgi:hypothetical protein
MQLEGLGKLMNFGSFIGTCSTIYIFIYLCLLINLFVCVFLGVGSIRTVKSGLLVTLLRIFERWERYEGKVRLKICSNILVTLQHLCSTSELNFYVIAYVCETVIVVV